MGAAAGKLSPGPTRRTGVPIGLISHTSVPAAEPEAVAVADGLGTAAGPAWPPGRVTSNWPAEVQTAFRILSLPESPSRLSKPYVTPALRNDGGTTGGMGARTVVKCTTAGVGATAGFGLLGLDGFGVARVALGFTVTV